MCLNKTKMPLKLGYKNGKTLRFCFLNKQINTSKFMHNAKYIIICNMFISQQQV